MLPRVVIDELRQAVGSANVLDREVDLALYAYDAYLEERRPDAVVFVTSTEEVSAVLRTCHRHGVPFVPRGGGTNLTGGTIPASGGVVVETIRMNRILEIDRGSLRARVQPGLFNLELGTALAPLGYQYLPDPASQKACTLGGNVAENAGGPHCFKYGVTTNHVLGVALVLSDGRVVRTGGKAADAPGYDLTGLVVGSEGTFGIVTEICVRIVRLPEAVKTLLAVYDRMEDASSTVSAIVAAGLVPATLEMMDRLILQAVEESFHFGFPLDCEAVLIIEVDGLQDDLEGQVQAIAELCRAHQAREVRVARDDAERAALWAGRRGAFGAVARLTPNYLVCDGTVPRTALPAVLREVEEVGRRSRLRIPNVFHAGDGNLHPLILFDSRDREQTARVLAAGMEILKLCVAAGGTISGEHGVGLEKIAAMRLVHGEPEIGAQLAVKRAFDPGGLANPGKMFPPLRAGTERKPPHPACGAQETSPPPRPSKRGEGGGEGLRDRLAALAGADRVESGTAMLTVRPASQDELAAVVRACAEAGASMVPWGGGSATAWGSPPARADVAISLAGLNRVVEHDRANLTVTVEAGATLADLQRTLAAGRQFLPLDPPGGDGVTVGGMLASNASGPGRLLYGTARDWVLGTRVVLPDGQPLLLGGRVIKNVSGYDMNKLFIGSFGTLGIITEATLKLLPLQAIRAGVVASFPDLGHAAAVVAKALDSVLLPEAMELLCPETMALLPGTEPSEQGAWGLAVAVAGSRMTVERQLRDLTRIAGEGGARGGRLLLPEQFQGFWERVRQLPDLLSGGREDRVAFRIGVPISKGPELAGAAREVAETIGLQSITAAHAGSGIVRGLWRRDGPAGRLELVADVLEGLRLQAETHEGWLVITAAPPAFLTLLDPWGKPGESFELMRRLKAEFDPRGLMNPGRFLGGL